MITAHVIGAGGYAAADLIAILDEHPDVALGVLESRSGAGMAVREAFPMLHRVERRFDGEGAVAAALRPDDVVFIAADRVLARELVPNLLAAGARVIDLSDAFRLEAHAGEAVYGFPERYRERIARARLIANPGCYVMTSLLALVPLGSLGERIAHVIIDAKSGITGAGRSPALNKLFAEVDEDVHAYGLTGHRHHAEIVQEAQAAGITAPVTFSPHVVPLRRGLLADVYLVPRAPISRDEILACWHRAYDGSPFVQILDGEDAAPYLPALVRTNDAQLAVAQRDGVVHLLSALDNLGRGAAGLAVQNMNLMLGLPEERGFRARTAV